VVESEDEDEDVAPHSSSKPKPPAKGAVAPKEEPKTPSSSVRRAEDRAAMEAMLDMDMDDDDDLQGESQATTTSNVAPPPAKKSNGKRKVRRVKRSETKVNEKGYMGTLPETQYICTDEHSC
jgi:hypothetical protein